MRWCVQRLHLSAEARCQIFIEATMAKARGDGSISEVLRRWGIHSSDLSLIRKAVEEAAISGFKARKSRRPKIEYDGHLRLKDEKERLEKTVVERPQSGVVKKKDRSA